MSTQDSRKHSRGKTEIRKVKHASVTNKRLGTRIRTKKNVVMCPAGPGLCWGRPAVNYQTILLFPRQAVEAWEPSNRAMLCLPGNKVSLTSSTTILSSAVYVFTAMEIRTMLFGYDITAGSWVRTFRRKILTISLRLNDAVRNETIQREMTG
jgi:hypothetical protein